MSRFQGIAWGMLFAIAALTVFMASLADLGLRLIASQIPPLLAVLQSIAAPPSLFVIREVIVGFIIGVSAVGMLERGTTTAQVRINRANLWALILCLAIALWVRSFVPLYGIFISGLNYTALVGVLCGVFWHSRRYWRFR